MSASSIHQPLLPRLLRAWAAGLALLAMAGHGPAQPGPDFRPGPDATDPDPDHGPDHPRRPNRHRGGPPGEPGHPPLGPGMRQRLIQHFDTDGDGKLTGEELENARNAVRERMSHGQPHAPEVLARFDTDGNGKLSPDERENMRRQMKHVWSDRKDEGRAELLKRFDTDGDGHLSESEKAEAEAKMKERWEKHRRDIISRFDTDGDGRLSESEKAAARRAAADGNLPPPPGPSIRPPPPGPGPGPMGPGNPPRLPERLRKAIDTNGDGFIDEAEREAGREKFRAWRERNGDARPPSPEPEFD